MLLKPSVLPHKVCLRGFISVTVGLHGFIIIFTMRPTTFVHCPALSALCQTTTALSHDLLASSPQPDKAGVPGQRPQQPAVPHFPHVGLPLLGSAPPAQVKKLTSPKKKPPAKKSAGGSAVSPA